MCKKNFLLLFILMLILPINIFAKIDISSISSSASELDSNNITSITKSIPSSDYAESSNNVDIVLVLDNSDTNIDKINSEAISLIDNLKDLNLNIKLSVIKFDGWYHDTIAIVRDNKNDGAGLIEVNDEDIDTIKEAINYNLKNYFGKYVIGGTNTELPLRMAKKLLDEDTEVDASRKYIVLFSDMESWVYEGSININGTEYESAPVTKSNIEYGAGTIYADSDYTWDELYSSCKDGSFEKQENYDKNQYFNYQYSKTVFGYTITLKVSWQNYWNNIYTGDDKDELLKVTDEQYRNYFKNDWNPYVTSDGRTITKKASGLDVSLCKTYNVLKDIKDSNYNLTLYSVDTVENANQFGHKAIGLIKAMQTDFDVDVYGNTEADPTIINSGDSVENLFANVSDSINYFILSGSIEDQLSKNFMFVDNEDDEEDAPFTISIDNKKLKSVKLTARRWGFGNQKESGKYEYEVAFDEDSNKLSVDFNEPVKNTSPIVLQYKLKLLTLETNKYPTSESTVFTYYDSLKKENNIVNINIPEVVYTKANIIEEVKENPKTGINNNFYILFIILASFVLLHILNKNKFFKKNI